MRVALITPYSYTYPGGVGRHVEALSEQLLQSGHDVRLLAPYDPDDRLSRVLHRGARPQARPMPEHLVPLGRTAGLPLNGAVSNLAVFPKTVGLLSRELRSGGYDVVHVHEPNAPYVSWYATEAAHVPTVGTFHTYSTGAMVGRFTANVAGARRLYSKLSARIAVSEAARWTAQRFYGGRYRIVPNGVDLSAARPSNLRPHDELQILFVGRAEARKGLPVLLRAFEALRGAGIRARLTVAGATEAEVEPLLLERDGVEVAGRVDDDEKWRLLGEADLLCAPSLGGESFGMVLTEAFASGTPVLASGIPGYREVVTDGHDGLLVPVGDAVELGEALRSLALDPERRTRMAANARGSAERFAWPHVAAEVTEVYEQALEVPVPTTRKERIARRIGTLPTEPGPRVPPQRLPSLEPAEPSAGRKRAARAARRAVVGAGIVAGVGLTALALQRIGIESIGRALLAATPVWVLAAFALMCASMLLRAEAWHAILRAALPGIRVRRRDTARATMIGVLMSATLPARLGEPSRALIMSRRLGRMRERFPVVLGTMVSQTMLNILALAVLGSVMFATVGPVQRERGRARRRHDRPRRAARARAHGALDPPPRQADSLPARAAGRHGGKARDARGTPRPRGLPQAEARQLGRSQPARRLGDPVARLLPAAGGARARRARRYRRCGRRAVRRERHGRAAGHAVEPRRLPGRLRGRAVGLRGGQDERARLRDHPAGRRDRDRARDGDARARPRGHDLEGPAPARPARRAGAAPRLAPARRGGRGRGLEPNPRAGCPRARAQLRRRGAQRIVAQTASPSTLTPPGGTVPFGPAPVAIVAHTLPGFA